MNFRSNRINRSPNNNLFGLITVSGIAISVFIFLLSIKENNKIFKKYTWPKPEYSLFGSTNIVLLKNKKLKVHDATCTFNESYVGIWESFEDTLKINYRDNNDIINKTFLNLDDSIKSIVSEETYYLVK